MLFNNIMQRSPMIPYTFGVAGPTTTSGGGVGRRRREIYDLNDREDENIYYQNPSSEELTDKDTTLDEPPTPDISMLSYMRTESPTTTASMLPSDRNAAGDAPVLSASSQSSEAENYDASDDAEHTVDVKLTGSNIQDKIAKNLLAADGETRAWKKVTVILFADNLC